MIIALQTLVFFRESILNAIERLLRPYYKNLALVFSGHGDMSDDEESEEQVYSEFDDEKGVVFYPPVYAQRYAAVTDCLMDERWCGKLVKVVDLGYHDMSYIKYLKDLPGMNCILGVDLDSIPLRCPSDILGFDDVGIKREFPLQVTLYQGNAADPDYRLIGCDAVVAIEMIEHMLPHDLERLVHTIFGFIKPWVVVLTTPNADFNVLFKALEKNGLRRWDHFFEWTREQFNDWCSNIVVRYPQYAVSCRGVGPGPPGTSQIGCCSQLALFIAKDYYRQQELNIDSLAIVANAPNHNNVSEMIGDCANPVVVEESSKLCRTSKLNCTTLQVKKFSKTTQNLMARNKEDSLIHTREVVDEICHLTSMLNFKGDNAQSLQNGENTWSNINWGDNAPYWNQYYNIVKEFNYPFEIKTEESRILELISEEVNRLLDAQGEEEFAIGVQKLHVPLEQLMCVVRHVTENADRVKDILEWNGYQFEDNVLIHSRLVDTASAAIHDEDWLDNETTSHVILLS